MWTPGMGELIIILLIVLMLFGTSKLKNIGKDLGGAISEFKGSMGDKDKDESKDAPAAPKTEDKPAEPTSTTQS